MLFLLNVFMQQSSKKYILNATDITINKEIETIKQAELFME